MWLLICPFKDLLSFNDILENYLSIFYMKFLYNKKRPRGDEVETILLCLSSAKVQNSAISMIAHLVKAINPHGHWNC